MRTVRCSGRLGGGGGMVPRWGVSAQGNVCLGVSAQGGGFSLGRCLSSGVSARGLSAGGCLPGSVSARHPPVNRMIDACENITLPQLRCGRKK